MNSFTDLRAWQVGMQLVKEIYAITASFPVSEQYGLSSQLRRASTSILANIAEGFSKRSPADKANKYTIARSECSETHAFLLICGELQFVSNTKNLLLISLVQEEGKLLSGLIHAHMQKGTLRPTPYAPRPVS
ncbi:MAG: four helix bundle protein [Candidatus Peregrinibacteria bacterium]